MQHPSQILTTAEIAAIEREVQCTSDPTRKQILNDAVRIAKAQKSGSIAKAFSGNGDRKDAHTQEEGQITTEDFLKLSPEAKFNCIRRRAASGRAKLNQFFEKQLQPIINQSA